MRILHPLAPQKRELLFFIGDIILHEEQGRDFVGDCAGSIHRVPIGKHDHRDEFARCDPRFFGLALSALELWRWSMTLGLEWLHT